MNGTHRAYDTLHENASGNCRRNGAAVYIFGKQQPSIKPSRAFPVVFGTTSTALVARKGQATGQSAIKNVVTTVTRPICVIAVVVFVGFAMTLIIVGAAAITSTSRGFRERGTNPPPPPWPSPPPPPHPPGVFQIDTIEMKMELPENDTSVDLAQLEANVLFQLPAKFLADEAVNCDGTPFMPHIAHQTSTPTKSCVQPSSNGIGICQSGGALSWRKTCGSHYSSSSRKFGTRGMDLGDVVNFEIHIRNTLQYESVGQPVRLNANEQLLFSLVSRADDAPYPLWTIGGPGLADFYPGQINTTHCVNCPSTIQSASTSIRITLLEDRELGPGEKLYIGGFYGTVTNLPWIPSNPTHPQPHLKARVDTSRNFMTPLGTCSVFGNMPLAPDARTYRFYPTPPPPPASPSPPPPPSPLSKKPPPSPPPSPHPSPSPPPKPSPFPKPSPSPSPPPPSPMPPPNPPPPCLKSKRISTTQDGTIVTMHLTVDSRFADTQTLVDAMSTKKFAHTMSEARARETVLNITFPTIVERHIVHSSSSNNSNSSNSSV